VIGRFGVDPCSHRGVCPPRRHDFPARSIYSHFELSRFDGPRFPCRGSHPTHSNGEVQRIVKTSLGRMVKCWVPNIFLINPSLSHQPSLPVVVHIPLGQMVRYKGL
jgi:hypothetical protein